MLIVQTDESLVDANSYVSVLDASAYIEAFLPAKFSQWTAVTAPQKEALLIAAAKYLDSMLRWQSALLNPDQLLEWPRVSFVDASGRTVEGVPQMMKDSQIRLTIESLDHPLYQPQGVLKIDAYGKSSQTYESGKLEGSGVTQDVRRVLLTRGYGRSSTSIVEFSRV